MADYHGAASEGARAQNLMKKREKQREEIEKLKQKIADVSISEYGAQNVCIIISFICMLVCVCTFIGCRKQREV